MKTSLTLLSLSLAFAASPPAAFSQEPTKTGVATEGEEASAVHHPGGDKKAYSAYAQRDFPTRVFFGDTHNHTANSGDAFMGGNRLTPEEAYRFARGEEVVASSGIPAKLSRPLDFLCVSDHAEGLGLMFQVYEGNEVFMKDEVLAGWNKAMKAGGQAASDAANNVVLRQSNGTLPAPIKDPKIVVPIMKSVWQKYTETAEKYNDPGRFTAMIAYEWTSVPGGNNLHRNILFRDGKDKADQIMPFSAWQSEDAEDLWKWMDAYEKKTGGKLLAIPHNGNLSNGQMFALTDFKGNPLSADYAKRRARWEPLHEVMQTKGNSETHPTLSPNDEFAEFGVAGWEYGNLTLTDKPATPEMRPFSFIRGALMNGLMLEQKLGTNPFKIGMIGGTDVHNSLTSIEEDNFYGKLIIQEPQANRWEHVSKQGFGKTRYTWNYEAAGYAAVWAKENTRESLWDAMMRKECYATSGSRITARFFGGWNYSAEDAKTRYLPSVGYAKGVPMGADLPKRPDGAKAPTFLLSAMKDALGANLDRIQIIKGWLDKDGETHEKIYEVAWGDADKRPLGADGKLPPVGDTVDVANATWTNTIGDPDLAAQWTDPDFDPTRPAFYYARVIEIPSPRWTAYDCVRYGIKMPAEVPMKHQERAWTSPIWYNP